ncbi:hypothetical protein EL22_28215 [Halostagnicola sp. A56]|nr:hypothetical protein EL22_28215 [Halostagnicola sp. A56]
MAKIFVVMIAERGEVFQLPRVAVPRRYHPFHILRIVTARDTLSVVFFECFFPLMLCDVLDIVFRCRFVPSCADVLIATDGGIFVTDGALLSTTITP